MTKNVQRLVMQEFACTVLQKVMVKTGYNFLMG